LSLSLTTVLVLLLYLSAVTAFGSYLGRRRKSVDDYFLAERSVPWWAVAACVVATETSVLTFTSVPGFAYTSDWSFLQLVLGYVLGRILIALVLVPAYFRGKVFTSYELLKQRFGPSVRSVAAGVFLVYRTLADGIRLHAAALVVAIAIGVPEIYCILVLAAAMILYTEEGGVKATIWTDVIQMFVYLAGAFIILATVVSLLPGSAGEVLARASQAGKLRVLVPALDFATTYTFASGVIGGLFLTLATHGTDHYLVQRLLVAKSARQAGIGLALSGLFVAVQFVLFLEIGTLLWGYYQGRAFSRGDEVLPTFVSESLQGPLLGFILAGVVAAALSPSLNSLASTTLKDFYLPYVDAKIPELKQIQLGRLFTVFWGLAQTTVAIFAQRASSALEAGLAALSFASGPTVGAFLLAVMNRRASSRGALAGMLAGLVAPFLLGQLAEIAWTWNVAIGATVTFVVGSVLSSLATAPREAER
jgi:SSS family transporter